MRGQFRLFVKVLVVAWSIGTIFVAFTILTRNVDPNGESEKPSMKIDNRYNMDIHQEVADAQVHIKRKRHRDKSQRSTTDSVVERKSKFTADPGIIPGNELHDPHWAPTRYITNRMSESSNTQNIMWDSTRYPLTVTARLPENAGLHDPVKQRRMMIDAFKAMVHNESLHMDAHQTGGWDVYFKYKNNGSRRLWPAPMESEDRIMNQIHYSPKLKKGELMLHGWTLVKCLMWIIELTLMIRIVAKGWLSTL